LVRVRSSRFPIHLLSALAAVALLILQTVAIAHEVEHNLNQHDEPTCALHLYTGHAGHPAYIDSDPLIVAPASIAAAPFVFFTTSRHVLAYRGRAPPRGAFING
jgi:hypothetical protein